MHWPDIFFRAKPPRRREKELSPLSDNPTDQPQHNSEIESEASLADSSQPLPVSKVILPPAPIHSGVSDLGVVKDMAEADTLRELTRSGGVRLIKRDFAFPENHGDPRMESVQPSGISAPEMPLESSPSISVSSAEVNPPISDSSTPPAPMDAKKSSSLGGSGRPAINLSGSRESKADGVYPSAMTIFRRRTKIADVARIILPPKREEAPSIPGGPPGMPSPAIPPSNAVPASFESEAIVIPASFPVAVTTRSARPAKTSIGETKPMETILLPLPFAASTDEDHSDIVNAPPLPEELSQKTDISSGTEMPLEQAEEMKPISGEKLEATSGILPAPSTPEPIPKLAETVPPAEALSVGDTREKREFVLSNGERILGHILSETPEAIYIDHGTLGVLTIPRAQIAQRPVEIILINGDRVVGDIIAETADSLFVRHASLGILTVPRNQRSTRVVEAILKDGDRILGEILGETESFIVIRSATLGTVAVPHNRVAMLNRRAEQVEMKALPPPTLENKSTA